MRLPAHRFLNYVLAWCRERIEPDKYDQWWWQLNAPLPGQKKPTEAMIEDEGNSFLAFMGTHAQVAGG